MSNVNIEGAIKNIHSKSTPYVPIVEAIVNSIDSIDEARSVNGEIDIILERESMIDGSGTAQIISITVKDNGIGFTDANRNSFDTLYSTQKFKAGGKGYGRMFFLKHFEDVEVESVFCENGNYKLRTFTFGKKHEIVENEKVVVSTKSEMGTSVRLKKLKLGDLDQDLELFSHRILEKILSYFSSDDYTCPTITIVDSDNRRIILNNLVGKTSAARISILASDTFSFGEINFHYKLFKNSKPRNQKSQIVLTAHNQSVTNISLHEFIPEFESEFTDENGDYIVYFYVDSEYLNSNVRTERDGFIFSDNRDLLYPVGRKDVEYKVSEIAKEVFRDDVKTRYDEKVEKYKMYSKENIWYSHYADDIDYSKVKTNPTKQEMENVFHERKYSVDLKRKQDIEKVIGDSDSIPTIEEIDELVEKLKNTDISNLAHYMAYRKLVIGILEKALMWNNEEDKHYEKEKSIHSIIFPMQSDSESECIGAHNLWLLDESLSFVEYLSSDQHIFSNSQDRPDILAFHRTVSFSETQDGHNPVSIFEFKRPGRDDFASKTSKENPVTQVERYARQIKNGEAKTPIGKNIVVTDATPYYAYVIADVNKKVKEWLESEEFAELPDNEGFYKFHRNYKMHIYYLSWNKVVKDSTIRHRKFFEKLGIEGAIV